MTINDFIICFIICVLLYLVAIITFSFLKKRIPLEFMKSTSMLIMRVAEKYVSLNGNIKMEFVYKCILFIYNQINKFIKIKIPDEKDLREYLQTIFNIYSKEINKIGCNITEEKRKKEIIKEINDIIKDEDEEQN